MEEANLIRIVSGNEILDEEECSTIIQELEPVAHRWYEIGLALGLTPNSLDRLKALAIGENDFIKLLTSMIVEWLRMGYNTARFGKPTWKRIVEVVRANYGGRNPALADELEKRHCDIVRTQPAPATPTSPVTETTQTSPQDQTGRCCCVGWLRSEREPYKISEGRVEFNKKEITIPRAFTAPKWDNSLESSKNLVLAHPTWQIQEIVRQRGYWGALTGREAEDHLRSCGSNCYLIRYSQSQEKYVISVMRTDAEPAIQHYQVSIRRGNDRPTYGIEGTEEWFTSVAELLRFYQKTPLTRSNRTIGEVCVKQVD